MSEVQATLLKAIEVLVRPTAEQSGFGCICVGRQPHKSVRRCDVGALFGRPWVLDPHPLLLLTFGPRRVRLIRQCEYCLTVSSLRGASVGLATRRFEGTAETDPVFVWLVALSLFFTAVKTGQIVIIRHLALFRFVIGVVDRTG